MGGGGGGLRRHLDPVQETVKIGSQKRGYVRRYWDYRVILLVQTNKIIRFEKRYELTLVVE